MTDDANFYPKASSEALSDTLIKLLEAPALEYRKLTA
jgi:hypothetical protein